MFLAITITDLSFCVCGFGFTLLFAFSAFNAFVCMHLIQIMACLLYSLYILLVEKRQTFGTCVFVLPESSSKAKFLINVELCMLSVS